MPLESKMTSKVQLPKTISTTGQFLQCPFHPKLNFLLTIFIFIWLFFFLHLFDTLRILKTIEKEREGKIEFTLANFLYFMNDVFSFPVANLRLCVRNKGNQVSHIRFTLRVSKKEEKEKVGRSCRFLNNKPSFLTRASPQSPAWTQLLRADLLDQ